MTLPVFLKRDRMRLPALRFWNSNITFDASAGTVLWDDLPRLGFGAIDRYELIFRANVGREEIVNAMWFEFEAHSPSIIDPRVLEDTAGRVLVTAQTKMKLRGRCERDCGRVFRPSIQGAAVKYQGPGTPPSRGKPCVVGAPDGRRISNCYLTDGHFFRDLLDYRCSEQIGCEREPRKVGIDLGAVKSIEMIVARGCSFCRVSVSVDGRQWRPVRETDGDSGLYTVAIFAPQGPSQARFIRVSDPESIFELSYW